MADIFLPEKKSGFFLRIRYTAALLLMSLLTGAAYAQTTLSTTSTFLNNNGSGTVTFNLQNTNTYPVMITNIAGVTGSSGTQTVQLWYKPMPISGSPGAISTANGWTMISSGTITGIANTSNTNTQPFLSGLTFMLPANTTYGFAVFAGGQRYFTMSGATTISAGGVNFLGGPNISYGGGTPPAAPSNTPRGWIGQITFVPATPCSGTPLPPVMPAAAANPTCSGTTATITATNPNQASGLNFQWQQSTASTGPWADVTAGVGGTTLSYTTPALTATTWYRLRITCSNSQIDTVSAPYEVQVVNPQIATTAPAARCSTGTVTLSATGTGTGIKWYSAATSGTLLSSSASYTTPSISSTTTYYAVASHGTCESSPRTAVVATVNALPTATATYGSSPTFCTGFTLLNANTGTNLAYQWQQNGTNITGATASTYQATTSGSYGVVVTNTATGCTRTSTPLTVTSGTPPPAPVTPSGSTGICQGNSTTLSTPSFGGLSYQWNLNGTPITGANSASYAATLQGNYTVTVSTAPGCSTTTATPAVVFYHTPPPAVISAPHSLVCQGSTLLLSANTGSGLTYQWQNNGTNISGATGATYGATNTGNYTVIVKNSTTTCTTASAPVAITQVPLPGATVTPAVAATACDSVPLSANTGANLVYQWTLNGANIPNANTPALEARTSGNYSVKVTDANNCVSTATPLAVTVNPSPAGYITYSGPLEFCAGSAVVLNTPHAATNTYQWRRDGSAITGATDFSFIAAQSGTYSLLSTNSFGCSRTSQQVPVRVNPLPTPAVSSNGSVLNTGAYAAYQWFHNGQPLPGATGSSVTLSRNGAYSVLVTDSNGCQGTSPVFFVGSLSVGQTAGISGSVRIFPNPARDRVHISAPVPVQVTIRDMQGRIVLSGTDATELDISRLAAGVYNVQVRTREGALIATEKLLKSE